MPRAAMPVEVELQRAVHEVLTGASIGADVYDIAPQASDGGATGPYVTIGRTVTTMEPVDEVQSFSVVMRIHTFSRTGSMLECRTIQGAIYDALHNSHLVMTGFECWSILREMSDVMSEQDGRIHGVCEYRALIQTQ